MMANSYSATLFGLTPNWVMSRFAVYKENTMKYDKKQDGLSDNG